MIEAEEAFDAELTSSSDDEFYARLLIDLNTCYDVTWAATTTKVLLVNSNGEPMNSKGSIYSSGTTKLTKAEYVYNDVHVASNGTNTFTFTEVYRTALRSIFGEIWEQQ